MSTLFTRLSTYFGQPVSIAPLVVYRLLFGSLVLYAWGWSLAKDDWTIRYLEPVFFFKYYGLEWLGRVGETGLYVLYGAWLLAGIGIVLGLFYRIAIGTFFLVFSYFHFLDASNYINHYYAISLLAFLLSMVPAHAAFSLDVWRKPSLHSPHIARGYILVLQAQVAVIYIFAAIGKINEDWLWRGMPLRIWLLQSQDFPILGAWFKEYWVALLASWVGFLFDLLVVFGLSFRRTRWVAYIGVLAFHGLTGALFNIGLFPWVMITSTVLFFAPAQQQAWLKRLGVIIEKEKLPQLAVPWRGWTYLFIVYFVIQVALPLRHWVLYTGNPCWTEEGARFSWWVMLVEKEGFATFEVTDSASGRVWEVNNLAFLTPFQEKRMAIRPDHILQFAHYLAALYQGQEQLEARPEVRAKVYVTLNGRVSQLLIDPTVNLAAIQRDWRQKTWVLPLKE
ncbi:MAG: HTTM domain-containing protein [Aureispira sp.]